MSKAPVYKPKKKPRVVRHEIRGIDYAVSEWGNPRDPMFVYLHGWGDCAATFQFVVDELQHGWYVVAPDWRGFGSSGWNAASYWFPDYLADLDRLLGIYSPDEPVRIVGHSMGANAAGLYAGSIPERVRAFVNVEGFGLRDTDPADAPQRYRRWMEAERAGPAFSAFDDLDALAARVAKRAPNASDAAVRFVARAWTTTTAGELRLSADPRHKLPNPVLYRRAEAVACWQRVTAPVLLVAGAESEFGPDASPLAAGVLELPFPDAEVRVIDDVGHMMHFEAPRALARAIEAFFGETL